jgi:alkanesulfonate monooxygenase SsuD/methylene tetrahydromethanopterin reductase-like flavin-dependent oxidoreductase (luciferase family)
VGGHNQRALRRTIELGDAWHAIKIDAEPFRDGVDRLRVMAEVAGRPMPAPTTLCELRIGGRPGVEDWRLSGSAEAIAAKIDRFATAGCVEMVLSLPRDSTDEMLHILEAFATAVRPLVEDRGANARH